MSVEKVNRSAGPVWRVRWREGGRNRARTFDLRRDALRYETEVRRRAQLGSLAQLDAGAETLDGYVTGTWAPTHAVALAASTRAVYAHVYDRHLSPHLGSLELRAITPETVARWQAQRLAAGVGAHAVRKAITVLGAILQRAVEAHRIPYNPVRATRKAKLPERGEVRPLAPRDVEAMRAFLLAGGSEHPHRDACLVSVLAYAGLRPGEALALTWGNVLDGTLVVNASKTGRRRSVRLLAPLAGDLREWRLASGRPGPNALLFPASDGKPWSHEGYKSWARRAFRRAAISAGAPDATPYTLRHSFVSLLLAEGRNPLDVAGQAGHRPSLSLDVYGHLYAEQDGRERTDAETLIRTAREGSGTRLVPAAPVAAER